MIYIQNHYSRNIDELKSELSGMGLEYFVSTDNTDYKDTRNDMRYMGVASNHLRIINHKTNDKWKIILHDDIGVYDGLFDKINFILDSAPETIVSFFHQTNNAIREHVKSGRNAYKTYHNVWFPCMAFPTSMADDYLAWVKKHVEMGKLAEDGMLSRYLSINEIPVCVVMPSLVQHDGFNKSLFNNPAKVGKNIRNSFNFDKDFDVYAVDWAKEFSEAKNDKIKNSHKTGLKNL